MLSVYSTKQQLTKPVTHTDRHDFPVSCLGAAAAAEEALHRASAGGWLPPAQAGRAPQPLEPEASTERKVATSQTPGELREVQNP